MSDLTNPIKHIESQIEATNNLIVAYSADIERYTNRLNKANEQKILWENALKKLQEKGNAND